MRAPAGFHTEDALSRQGIVLEEEVSILACVDVVGNDGQVVVIPQSETELAQQRGLAGSHRAPDTHSQAMWHSVVSC